MRCLVVLLSLSLVSGNAHAALHLGSVHPEPCPQEHDHAGTKPAQHHHQPVTDLACCCDCLGCISAAALTPEPAVCPADLHIVVRYDVRNVFLTGCALSPEPDPPRPATLI